MGFITIEGENQIAAKQGGGLTLNIANFVLANIAGLGAEPADRIEAMPIAGDIVDMLPVTMAGYVNTNQVVYSLTMDSSIGDYDFNWIGLVDDEGKLIAVTYTPLIQKRATAGAVPGNNLTRNFLIAYSGIQATVAIAVPAATWQIDFNARLQGIDERERLANFDLYGHDGFIGDGYSIVRQGATTTYDVLAGVGYVGGIRINNAATQQVVAAALDSIWLDVSLEGDISDVSPVINFVIDAAVHNDYLDGNGVQHYLTKLSDIAADGSVTDTRVGDAAKKYTDDAVAGHIHNGYITGLTLSNNAIDLNNDIDIAIGKCASDAGEKLSLDSVLTKQLDAIWAIGSDAGGLFSGAKAINTWYHVFLIKKDSDGTIDAGFDTSVTALNIPAGYTAYRRIGSVLTDAAGNITPFIQHGDYFNWLLPQYDLGSSLTTARVEHVFSSPLGIDTLVRIDVSAIDTSTAATRLRVYSPYADDDVVNDGNATFNAYVGTTQGSNAGFQVEILTNKLSQVSLRVSIVGLTFYFKTVGYTDFRGR